jgi:Ca2+-transporting ATPase
MAHPPRRLTDRVIDREMQLGVALVGLVMAVVTLLMIDLKLPGGLIEGSDGLVEARTAGFTVLVLAQLFNCFSSRSDRASAFRGLFTNRWLWAAIALSLLLQVLVVHVPLLNRAFGTTVLSAGDWALCAVLASAVLWADRSRSCRHGGGHPGAERLSWTWTNPHERPDAKNAGLLWFKTVTCGA